jgi:hypothetical protein
MNQSPNSGMRKAALIVSCATLFLVLAGFGVIVAANHGVDIVLPAFKR